MFGQAKKLSADLQPPPGCNSDAGDCTKAKSSNMCFVQSRSGNDWQGSCPCPTSFKSKWDSQKAAILSQKKTEIDAHLQREDDIAQAEFAKTAVPCSCFL